MGISPNYKFLLYIGVLFAFITGLLSALTTFVIWSGTPVVPVWGTKSAVTQHLLTSFIYGFILGLLSTSITRKALRARKIIPLHWHLKSQTLIDRLPSNTIHRSFMLGLAGSLMAGISLFLFNLKHTQEMALTEYIIFKSIFGAFLGAVVTVMAVYRAMGDTTVKPTL